MVGTEKSRVAEVPKYGIKLKLDHVYPEKVSPDFRPSWKIVRKVFVVFLRYLWYYIVRKIQGRPPFLDYIKPRRAEQIYGVPIGGIGCGSIGRGYKGEFCRFQLRPGIYEWNTVDANQFIVTIKDENQITILHSLLTTFKRKSLGTWESTIDGSRCSYTGLYPRSWTEYDLSEYGVKLTCRQVSPVIPHDYKNSSLPCAVFVWDIQNTGDEERTVTVAFTFKNGTGTESIDKKAVCSTEGFIRPNSEGVILHNTIDQMPCAYVLSAKTNEDVKISKCMYFDPKSDGAKPWFELKNKGEFQSSNSSSEDVIGEMACGIAVKTTIGPSNNKKIEMNLVWHMPEVRFMGKRKAYSRFYTKYFAGDQALLNIVDYAFENYGRWEESIYDWQKGVLENSSLPDWYKSALFNQTYYVSDGGSVWFTLEEDEASRLPDTDPRKHYGRFAYLEAHEYLMYNSYDVHFYASHAFHQNWPYLQKSLHYDLRDLTALEITEKIKILYNGSIANRKYKNLVPHDAGEPGDDPFLLPNAYVIHDISEWKDLNSKFILQTYRDAFVTTSGAPDRRYVEDMYETCRTLVEKTIELGLNADGLIENNGCPDQTYDMWVMTGVSSYCGGLWLSALYVMIKMADLLGKSEDRVLFEGIFQKGREAFDHVIWNGKYYNFDTSENQGRVIMADQLCGHWYLRCCGIDNYEVFPKDKVTSALQTIYENNVLSFCDGTLGAVNGTKDGQKDCSSLQSQEVWTSVTYTLAATMIYEGMTTQALKTAGGMYETMTNKQGLAYDYPEALYEGNMYRSLGYMRPLSIWSMQMAFDEKSVK